MLEFIDLDKLISEATGLEPLPQSSVRLAALIADEEWDLGAVADVVRLDQSLTGRLLSAANSVASGNRAPISTVDAAVMRMGPGLVLSFALADAVRGQMNTAIPALRLSEGELWRHSVASALAMDLLRDFVEHRVQPEAFAVALLHDMGKLVLGRHLDEHMVAFLDRAQAEGGLTVEEAEQKILRVSHAEVGALIARDWNLPESIALGIQHHHSPLSCADSQARRLCSQVALADAAAHCIDHEGHGGETWFTPDLAGALGINQHDFGKLCEGVQEKLEEVLADYR